MQKQIQFKDIIKKKNLLIRNSDYYSLVNSTKLCNLNIRKAIVSLDFKDELSPLLI